jgi:hypothetical protein
MAAVCPAGPRETSQLSVIRDKDRENGGKSRWEERVKMGGKDEGKLPEPMMTTLECMPDFWTGDGAANAKAAAEKTEATRGLVLLTKGLEVRCREINRGNLNIHQDAPERVL